MDRVASALQAILAKPVVNETRIEGAYRLDLAWGEDRVATLTAALRNKFGLELTPSKREMEALVVERMEPDGALSVIRRLGRWTERAPLGLRRAVSRALTIHWALSVQGGPVRYAPPAARPPFWP